MLNQIHQGDCLEVLATLPEDCVDLVYLDPPFFTQQTQTLRSKALQVYAFEDSWDSMPAYLAFLKERVCAVQRVMKPHATLFLHCDRHASHYIRVMLDEVFGYDRFVSEIIWTYRRWSHSTRALLPSHQTIFMYANGDDYTFNDIFLPYSETTNLDQILQKRERNPHGKTAYVHDEQGEIILNGEKKGVPLSDTWDIPYLNPKAKERTGYPTQKPLLLLERILQLSSHEGAVVLDPFCGSGTTCVAAHLLQRHYIGIDQSPAAVHLTRQRLENPIRTRSAVLEQGREAYHNLPDYVVNILNTLPVKLVQRNSGIDALYDSYVEGKPIVIRVQREGESIHHAIQKLQQAGAKKHAYAMILIAQERYQPMLEGLAELPSSVIVVESLPLMIQQQLQRLEEGIPY